MSKLLRNSNKGIALLIVVTCVAVITVLVIELNYNARISTTLAANYKDNLRAYYLARSSVNIALLRLSILKKIRGADMGGFKVPNAILDLVWSLPFVFPPPEALFVSSEIDDEADLGTREMLKEIKEKINISGVGSFEQGIEGLDSKLNINILAQTEEGIQKFKEIMGTHYANKIESDESFGHRYPIEYFDEMLNNIVDWIDTDTDSRNGGDENNYYERQNPPYSARNSAMLTISEMHMIEGMTDELCDFISPIITVFSSGSINVNNSEIDMIKVIDNRLSDEEIRLFRERLEQEGPFEDETELRTWIGQNTAITSTNFNPMQIPLSFEE
ncbi:MAG: general secretion pathway protein GspK, partial [Oligoflexia bacterium]|nr:general secretion pathway protein GspK [Oligoflexia bacterium]